MSISTVWSVDVGKSSLKAVKIHRDQTSLEIVAVDKIDFEGGDVGIDSIGQAKAALRTFASRNTIDCPVAVLHPSRSAFSRFIQLPPVDPKKLEEMIGYEAQQQIPFPIEEVIWDHHVSESDDGSMEKEVGIFAVRREAISDFMLDYDEFPLELISIGYIGLLNYVLFDLRPNKPVVVLDMGSDHTDLLIVDGKRFWFRSLPSAGKDFTQALQEKFKLDYNQAEELKTEGAKSEHGAKIFQVMQPLIRDLVNEINRSIGFYKSQAGEVKFEDLFLFGNGSKLLGLKNSLTEHLKFRVHVAKGFHRLRVNRDANVALLQRDFPAFASCVGAGIQALGDGDCEVNLLPQEQQEALEFKKKQKTVIFAAASIYLLIGWMMFSYGAKVKSADAVLSQTAVVDQLKASEKEINKITGNRTADAANAAAELLVPVAQRLEPFDAWTVTQEIFASFDNGFTSPDPEIPKNALEDGKGMLTAAQELANDGKWWLTSVDIERAWFGPNNQKPGKKEARDLELHPAYLVTLTGVRYRFESVVKDTDQVRDLIWNRVKAHVMDRFGDDYPDELITLSITAGVSTTIYSAHPELKEGQKKSKITGDDVQEQGSLFEFVVSWVQPIVATVEAPSNEEGDKDE